MTTLLHHVAPILHYGYDSVLFVAVDASYDVSYLRYDFVTI